MHDHAAGQPCTSIPPAISYCTRRGFLDDARPAGQLEIELREFARAFETNPYKMDTAKIDREKVPQERLFAFVRHRSDYGSR